MKTYLQTTLWPLIAGLLSAMIIMMGFESLAHALYPFPSGMDTMHLESVRAFTKTLPTSAFLIVATGWFIGSLVAGYAITRLARDARRTVRLITIAALLLTALGVFNNLTFGAPTWFTTIGLFIFALGTYCGHHMAQR
jgi:sugar phosphate permease